MGASTAVRGRRALARAAAQEFFYALLFLFSCSVEARDIRITILCTTDVHGHVLPGRDYVGRENVGGLLRCASLLEAIRSEEKHVIYVDCGDLIQGAPECGITKGCLAIRALNWMGCDAWVFGNHDFDWSAGTLARIHDESRMPMLVANLRGAAVQRLFPRVQPYLVKDLEGVRIAMVGLTTPGIPAWLADDRREGIEFERSVTALRRIMPAVRSLRPDIMILLVHQGLPEFQDDHANELLQITREFPEWDVIFGGHTHKVMAGTRLGRALYVQAGYYGNWLARVDLTFDNVARKISDLTGTVIEIGTNWPEHVELRNFLGRDLSRVEKLLKRRIGWCDAKLSAEVRPPHLSDMQALIAEAIAWKTGADAVLVGYYGDEGLEPGPITMADIWRAIPYENTIGVVSLTPSELRMILAESSNWAGTRNWLGLWGLSYSAPGERSERNGANVILRRPDGKPVHGRQRLRIAASSYALASGGRRYPILSALARRPEARLQMTGIDTRNAVIEYVEKHKKVGVMRNQRSSVTEISAKVRPHDGHGPR